MNDYVVLTHSGEEVDELLDKVEQLIEDTADIDIIRKNAQKGATAIQNIPEEYVTEEELEGKGYAVARNVANALATKVSVEKGKGLSTEDFTTALKNKLEALKNYDDTAISDAIAKLRKDFDTLVESDTSGAIDKFNEIVAFLEGIEDSQSLDSIIASIEQQIASKQATIDDLNAIREGASKGATSVQGIYINGSYNGRKDNKGNIDLGSVVKTIGINGKSLTPDVDGVVDLGTIEGSASNDVYVLPFTYEELTEYATNNSAVTITQELIDAISANRVIVIKTNQLVITGNLKGAYIASATSIVKDTKGSYQINISVLYSVDLIMRFTLTSRGNTLVADVSKKVNKVATINGQSLAEVDNIAVISKMNVNGREVVPDVDGVVDLGTIGEGGGNVSFIDNKSLQGLPFGYVGGYYRSYEFDGTSSEEVNLGYIDNYYYDTIAIAYDDVLFEERIRELKGDGKVLRTVAVRVDDEYNLFVKPFSPKKATFGWRIYTDKALMPDSWVDLESYCTKSEVDTAIANAITTTLNTPV